jgi:hypothetical protein
VGYRVSLLSGMKVLMSKQREIARGTYSGGMFLKVIPRLLFGIRPGNFLKVGKVVGPESSRGRTIDFRSPPLGATHFPMKRLPKVAMAKALIVLAHTRARGIPSSS